MPDTFSQEPYSFAGHDSRSGRIDSGGNPRCKLRIATWNVQRPQSSTLARNRQLCKVMEDMGADV